MNTEWGLIKWPTDIYKLVTLKRTSSVAGAAAGVVVVESSPHSELKKSSPPELGSGAAAKNEVSSIRIGSSVVFRLSFFFFFSFLARLDFL